MEELIAALHIHTVYSDGSATHAELAQAGLRAGVDVLLVSDHNVLVQDMDGYAQKGKKRVLLLVGEEVHDRSSTTPGNHLLIFGHNKELSRYSGNRQQLLDQARQAGGLTFLAHPIDVAMERFGEKSFNWEDWSVTGFTGIELWNQMSEFKSRSQSLPKAALHALLPRFMTLGPLPETLKLWDELLASRDQPVVAVAGADAHGLHKQFGPLKVILYPYEFQFRSVTTHLVTPTQLTGEINADRQMVFDALRQGHCFCAYDLPHSARGFRFTCNTDDGLFWMGDKVSVRAGLTFQVRLPAGAHIRLIKDGRVIKETQDREVLTHITKEPGIYRAEAYLDYRGRHRGWIFSNPIYANK